MIRVAIFASVPTSAPATKRRRLAREQGRVKDAGGVPVAGVMHVNGPKTAKSVGFVVSRERMPAWR
jgi:hypothetical protein